MRDFVFEGTWVMELSSFIHQKPAKESFKALEPLELLAISRDNFFKLVESVPQFAQIYQKNLETSCTRSVAYRQFWEHGRGATRPVAL